jgi:hypothetical protein
VGISPADAADLVAKTVRDFRIQGNELKGQRLLKYASGRKAALAVIEELGARSNVVVVHKRYALACKVFEYTFEPLLSDVSAALYAVDFHKFIGTLLHFSSVKNHRAWELSERFEQAVRGNDEPLRRLLSVHSPDSSDPVEAVISFCVYHRDTILGELAEVNQSADWTLDVTGSSLNSLLTTWGRRARQLRVTCDESGPLASSLSYFDAWLGRDDKPTISLGERTIELGFNLAAPIAFAKSYESAGIQLADVVSSLAAKAYGESRDDWARGVIRTLLMGGVIHPDSIMPLVLDGRKTKLNIEILAELVRRSEYGESLTAGLVEFIRSRIEPISGGLPFL